MPATLMLLAHLNECRHRNGTGGVEGLVGEPSGGEGRVFYHHDQVTSCRKDGHEIADG